MVDISRLCDLGEIVLLRPLSLQCNYFLSEALALVFSSIPSCVISDHRLGHWGCGWFNRVPWAAVWKVHGQWTVAKSESDHMNQPMRIHQDSFLSFCFCFFVFVLELTLHRPWTSVFLTFPPVKWMRPGTHTRTHTHAWKKRSGRGHRCDQGRDGKLL